LALEQDNAITMANDAMIIFFVFIYMLLIPANL